MPFSGPPLDHAVSVTQLLRAGMESKPDDVALISLRARWTWRELDGICGRLARNLLGLGLKPGDRVASLMPNRCELLIHYMACLRAGLVATPLNYRYMAPEIDHALDVAQVSMLLAHAERDPDIARSRLAGRLPLGVIRYRDRETAPDGSDFETLMTVGPGNQPLPAPDPAAPAAIFFTSGSTGPAKGVTHTHDSLRWMFALNPPDGVIKIGSVGRPIPGYALSIRDDDGAEVPAGADGRLWVRSRSAMRGYWGAGVATAEVIRDGWLDTGDVMRLDADGYLWFRGRKKQIIVHDGSNICPQEVEEALLDHAAVAGAGVVGVHDPLHGEDVRAYVTIRPGIEPPTGRELIEFARARIGYKAPEHIVFLETMPLNPTGKVDRVTLKRMAGEGS